MSAYKKILGRQVPAVVIFFVAFILNGCASRQMMVADEYAMTGEYATMSAAEEPTRGKSARAAAVPEAEKKIIKRASVDVEVPDVKAAQTVVERLATDVNGEIENSRLVGTHRSYIYARVPADKLESFLTQVTDLGKETKRQISMENVTKRSMDLEAQLTNKEALRKRLRELLTKAQDVKDIIAIEEKLSQVQNEIDALENALKVLNRDVALSPVNITLSQKVQLGPAGYVLKYSGLLVRTLFIIKGDPEKMFE